jgi:hypothetical protein
MVLICYGLIPTDRWNKDHYSNYRNLLFENVSRENAFDKVLRGKNTHVDPLLVKNAAIIKKFYEIMHEFLQDKRSLKKMSKLSFVYNQQQQKASKPEAKFTTISYDQY